MCNQTIWERAARATYSTLEAPSGRVMKQRVALAFHSSVSNALKSQMYSTLEMNNAQIIRWKVQHNGLGVPWLIRMMSVNRKILTEYLRGLRGLGCGTSHSH